jgi:hypothetical protein
MTAKSGRKEGKEGKGKKGKGKRQKAKERKAKKESKTLFFPGEIRTAEN